MGSDHSMDVLEAFKENVQGGQKFPTGSLRQGLQEN